VTTPESLEARGAELWASLIERHPGMSEAERAVALEACRTADLLVRLERIIQVSEPVIEDERGKLCTHPAIVEARQQRTTLMRLVASLRLPDAKTGERPQVRSARGAYGATGAKVSSIDRARAARGA
jgi:hypothetical protein